MKLILVILLTILLGLLLGPWIQTIPGTAVLVFEEFSVQMRLWQALVMLLVVGIIVAFLYHFILRFVASAGRLRLWSGNRRWSKARKRTIQGMIALAEGHWQQAEKLLVTAAKDTDTGLINYLAAAQAAQAQKAEARRDNYLRLAHAEEPEAEVAVGLTQAQLQLANKQIEEALASLTHLQRIAPDHGYVLTLLARLYSQLEEWTQLLELMPALKKSGALSETDWQQMQLDAWIGHIHKTGKAAGIEALHDVWLKIPRKLRHEKRLEFTYLQWLVKLGASLEAKKLLEQAIKKVADEDYLNLYGQLNSDDPASQLQFVERQVGHFDGSPTWYRVAGELCLKQQIWGKAKNYLEQAAALQNTTRIQQLLGQTNEALGDHDSAYQHYKAALSGLSL